jgi:hypothetical protein
MACITSMAGSLGFAISCEAATGAGNVGAVGGGRATIDANVAQAVMVKAGIARQEVGAPSAARSRGRCHRAPQVLGVGDADGRIGLKRAGKTELLCPFS